MLTVYAVPISNYCAKVRIVLRHKELQWTELAPPGGYGSDTYKLLVPSGNLPTLVDRNILIADSEAIAEYLDEKYPIPEMLPKDVASKATTRELSRFHDTRFEPELRKLFGNLSPDKLDIHLNAVQTEKINMRLLQLSNMVKKLPMKLMLAHCGYPVTFVWLDILTTLLSLNIKWPENLIKWRKKIESFPAVSEELGDYRPKIKKWVNSL